MAKKFLTLDIGAANVALAEYESSGNGGLTLINYGVAALAAPLDSGDAATILSPALLEIVRERGIKPGPVAISVSGQMVFPRFAAIPSVGGDDRFEQMVANEIEQNVPFQISEMICDHQVLGDTEGGDKSVMIVAAKTDQVEAITDAVTAVGFKPMLVDAAPLAVTNAVKAAEGDGDACVIALDIGAKTTSLIICEGDKVYNRSIPIAGNNITREIAQALGCSPEEADQVKREKGYVGLGGVVEDDDQVADCIAKVCRAVLTRLLAEISRSVNFYRSQQGGNAPTKLYLTGGTAMLPQLDQFFLENLQIEVVYLNPFDYVAVSPALDQERLAADGAMLAATVGLALHEAGYARFAINLLPPSIIADRAEKARIPVVAAAGAVFLVALALVYVATGRSSEAVESELAQVQSRLDSLRGYEERLQKADAEVEAAAESAGAFKALLASRSSSVVRLNAVRGALGGGMWIERWEPGKVTIRGWKDNLAKLVDEDAASNGGKRRTAPEITVARLKGSAAVVPESVKISDISSIGKNGDVEQFTVELAFK